jgi:hypothetical protein
MIFPVLETEDVVQVGDKTRLDASKSFVSKDEDPIIKVEIRPEATGDWVDVTGASSTDWYLDWIYSGLSRAIVPEVRVTTVLADPDATPDPIVAVNSTLTKNVSVLTVADDKLFSKDQDLVALESDIMKWVPEGRASFLNVHRAAQVKILEALDESGAVDTAGAKLTKAAVVDVTEVKAWSRDMTLALIFANLSNAIDDVFERKSKKYWAETAKRKQRAVIRLDMNGDGVINADETQSEGVNFRTMELIRR